LKKKQNKKKQKLQKLQKEKEIKTPSHKPQIAPSDLPEPFIAEKTLKKKAPPPRPWPPTNSQIIKKNKIINTGMSSSRVQRAISKFDTSASVNRNLRQNKKRAITMGYDADLAGSPTKMNPLCVENTINEESVDPDFD